jgi:ParB family chromosome partitioning protein
MTTKKQANRRRLGKGLGSLISTPVAVETKPPAAVEAGEPAAPPADSSSGIPVGAVRPNPLQPRKHFDEQSLEALAASIRTAGLMQPIVVRRTGDGYELVAGERRLRAAQRAGLETIPAIVREADDREMAELALIENLQREDLNPIERAEAFQRLIDDHGLVHQQVGELVGMDRSTVTNHLRLLDLEDEVQQLVRMGLLGLGHARALLALKDRSHLTRIAAKVAREGWSVRSTETEIKRINRKSGAEPPTPRSPTARRAHLADLEKRLSDHLGTRVQIRPGKKTGSGTMAVEFYNPAQFEGLMERLGFTV